jgi:hypothetical protein
MEQNDVRLHPDVLQLPDARLEMAEEADVEPGDVPSPGRVALVRILRRLIGVEIE